MVRTKTTKSRRKLKKVTNSRVVTLTPMTGKGNKKKRRLRNGKRDSSDGDTSRKYEKIIF